MHFIFSNTFGHTMEIHTFYFLLNIFVCRTFASSVCPETNKQQVVSVCSESMTAEPTNQVYLDTSVITSDEQITCTCNVTASKGKTQNLPYTSRMTFISGSSVEHSSYKVIDAFDKTKVQCANDITTNVTFDILEKGVVVTYRKRLGSPEISCLNISVLKPGVKIKASCHVNNGRNNHGFVTSTPTTLAPTSMSASTLHNSDTNNQINTPTREVDLAVPVGAGIGGTIFIILIVIAVVVIIRMAHKKRENKKRGREKSEADDNVETDNPMYSSMENTVTSEYSRRSNGPPYKTDNAYHKHVNIHESGLINPMQYTKVDRSHRIGPKGDIYSIPLKSKVHPPTNNSDRTDTTDAYSYASITSGSGLGELQKSKPAVAQRSNVDEVYDHTWDKTPIVSTNDYSHLGKMTRKQDFLNAYDTTANVSGLQMERSTQENGADYYDISV